ncbi:MAG: hypothetical protein E3J64_05920, partial [Anaerolineales bacterium]
WLEDGFGCRSELIHYGEWPQALDEYRAQAVVLPHVNGSRNQKIARVAREMGMRVVVIQTEGRPNNVETMAYTSGMFADTTNVDLWFTWSDTVRDYMIEQRLMEPSKLVVGGAHRFDVYRPDLNRLLASRGDFARKHGLDPDRPIVSWATNFTHAKFNVANQAFLLEDWRDLGVDKLESLSDPLEFARLDWVARERSLEVMRELMRRRGDVQYILKPHPAEELDRYREFVDECRLTGVSATLVAREYIWDVLNAADVHIHRLCTTGVEAWLLGVPSIELHLFDYGVWSVDLPGAAAEAMEGNDVVVDSAGLIAVADSYLRDDSVTEVQLAARERYIRKWLHKVDGRRCYEHARVLAELVRDRRPIGEVSHGVINRRARIRSRVNRSLGRPGHESLRFWRRGTGSGVDRLGQLDKTIAKSDAEAWTRLAREALREQVEATV